MRGGRRARGRPWRRADRVVGGCGLSPFCGARGPYLVPGSLAFTQHAGAERALSCPRRPRPPLPRNPLLGQAGEYRCQPGGDAGARGARFGTPVEMILISWARHPYTTHASTALPPRPPAPRYARAAAARCFERLACESSCARARVALLIALLELLIALLELPRRLWRRSSSRRARPRPAQRWPGPRRAGAWTS